ncbi:hypothetical protein BL254_18515 [Protofrankia sp. BMG5.30]|uniref:Uncharacterized protein n=1 Tax=Protofrankia coriariae TaxID=1562887 RepID=A0ABR5F2B7_9ACTN|nr:hypothetical protein FrCorBMG51_15550 [Protofrankia coriariae]ONH34031.1 hypothetical protein BL254_18515 [Protofrankia sp. BMG5.30]
MREALVVGPEPAGYMVELIAEHIVRSLWRQEHGAESAGKHSRAMQGEIHHQLGQELPTIRIAGTGCLDGDLSHDPNFDIG